MLDFWAFYLVGVWAMVGLWQGVAERNREKTTLFFAWKVINTALNGIGFLPFALLFELGYNLGWALQRWCASSSPSCTWR